MAVADITKQLETTTVDDTILSFAGKGFKLDNEDDASEIITKIKQQKTLKALNLEGNTLGIDAAKAIAQALEGHPEFQRALWSDMFTGRLKTEIPKALKYLGDAIMLSGAQLVELDLSDNAFGPNGMVGLTDLLKSKSCYTLKALKLNNNGLGVTGGKMLAESLLSCHKSSSEAGCPLALEVFVSGRGRLENEGSIALSEPFKLMGSLKEVSMPQNGINHEGITALATAFAANPNLQAVNLNDNTFTEKGARSMAAALGQMQNLQVVNFGDCLLRNKGAKYIANALKEGHNKLRELTLSFNEVRNSGAQTVAECMINKDSLQKLDLDGNQLGEDGIELVQGIMEAADKQDILGSFSDDEGVDSDEEEDAEEDVSNDEIQVPSPKSSSNEKQGGTIKDFLQFPSPSKLHQVGSKRAEALLEELGDDIHDVDRSVKVVIKVSLVVTVDDEKTKNAAYECADAVMSKVCNSQEGNIGALISNAILVHIGLLKGENKKLNPPSNIIGPLIVLSHIVKQSYFPKDAKDILQFILARPHPLLDQAGTVRHQLLQALYQ